MDSIWNPNVPTVPWTFTADFRPVSRRDRVVEVTVVEVRAIEDTVLELPPPTTLHKFNELPIEIRIIIWTKAIAEISRGRRQLLVSA